MTRNAWRRLIGIGVLALSACATNIATAADPQKILRTVFPAAETGFDPAVARDLYSAVVMQSIFETLYTYDYLARPAKLVPLTADGLPEMTDGGKTYTIRLKKGIYFYPDPAFGGKLRELTMQDYVYAFRRLFDPKLASPHTWLFEGKVAGLDALAAQAKKTGTFDYDSPVEGLELLDKYTLRIRLNQPDFNLGMILAHEPSAAVAREVIEKYRDSAGQVMANPVGTGPYHLAQWVRASRIVLEASPDWRGLVWDFKPGPDADDQQIIAQMKGKKMPQIGRVEIAVMIEDQSRLLAFQNDEIDLFELQGPLAPQLLNNGKLKPEVASKGVRLSRIVDPETAYTYWNMDDPIVGGFSKEKIALRRAIAMAHNVDEEIRLILNGEATALQYPIPPGVVGHDPAYRSSIQFDPPAANALLDKFGYKKGSDGFRMLPNGQPMTIKFTARSDSTGQQQAEMWRKTYASIGLRMVGDIRPFPDTIKAEKSCQLQTRTAAWIADYPDGDNFMQLYFGPNVGQTNNGCARIPEYDALYRQSQKLPAGAERDVLYRKMARIMERYTAQRMAYARNRNMVSQPRVIAFKKHPILHAEWLYFDIEKRAAQK